VGLRHPTADAFVRGILADPADRLRRLVFADWLDEQGGSANAAWAGYLRAQAEWKTLPADDPRRADLLDRAKWHRRGIRAHITLPAHVVRSEFLHLLKLLPSGNIRIRLSGEDIPRRVLSFAPESIARLYQILPVGSCGDKVAFATPTPRVGMMKRDIGNFLAIKPVMFLADADEVQQAIDRWYHSETESVGGMLRFPPFTESSDRGTDPIE
jgi:uncharacterized protein (TIGR02996 family)